MGRQTIHMAHTCGRPPRRAGAPSPHQQQAFAGRPSALRTQGGRGVQCARSGAGAAREAGAGRVGRGRARIKVEGAGSVRGRGLDKAVQGSTAVRAAARAAGRRRARGVALHSHTQGAQICSEGAAGGRARARHRARPAGRRAKALRGRLLSVGEPSGGEARGRTRVPCAHGVAHSWGSRGLPPVAAAKSQRGTKRTVSGGSEGTKVWS
jgi:hypothetical protein